MCIQIRAGAHVHVSVHCMSLSHTNVIRCKDAHACMYMCACMRKRAGHACFPVHSRPIVFLHDHLLASMQDVCTVNTWHHANEQNGERDVFRLRQGGLVEQTRLPAPPNLWLQSDKCKTCTSHMHTNIHERTHACSQAHPHTNARVHTHPYAHAHVHAHTSTCTHVRRCVQARARVCTWTRA